MKFIKIKISFLVILFVSISQIIFAANLPSDVLNHKYKTAIEFLYEEGIVNGYPDGTFRPDYELNRAELMKFILEGLNKNLDASKYKNCFPDVKDKWFAKYVCYAKAKNWIKGYADGFFRPGNRINKVEALKIVVNVYELEASSNLNLPYTDIDLNQWYIPFLRAAYANDLLEEKSGKYFPANNFSRGQISEVIYRYFNRDVESDESDDQQSENDLDGNDSDEDVEPDEDLDGDLDEDFSGEKRRLTENDFKYLGAFKVPGEGSGASGFGWGGSVMALSTDGDSNGANDGFPGSLFIVGHDQQQLVAEINIPAPKDQRTGGLEVLNEADYLQSFTDVTDGMAASLDSGNGFRISGLGYLDGKLYWTARTYYNVDGTNDLSHGVSNPDFSNLDAKGLWRLGSYHGNMTAGYIFPVPEYFANVYFEGKRLISGLFTQQGVAYTSQGPAMFAYDLDVQNPPANGATLETNALVYYPYSIEGGTELNPSSNFPDFQIPDGWNAGAWVDTDDAHAVVIVGSRSMGATYYGESRPGDCNPYKGYHGTPYEPRFAFYDPADLAKVAQGQMNPEDVTPYMEFNPQQYLEESCEWNLAGAVFDPENGLFYVLHKEAYTPGYDPMPLVYVFKVGN